MFWVSPHPSSGVLKTVTAASGTGHNIGTATSLQCGPIWPRWMEVALPILFKYLKYLKIFKIAPTCFGSQGFHHQGALYIAWLKLL